jgi:hypothetical protein
LSRYKLRKRKQNVISKLSQRTKKEISHIKRQYICEKIHMHRALRGERGGWSK